MQASNIQGIMKSRTMTIQPIIPVIRQSFYQQILFGSLISEIRPKTVVNLPWDWQSQVQSNMNHSVISLAAQISKVCPTASRPSNTYVHNDPSVSLLFAFSVLLCT